MPTRKKTTPRRKPPQGRKNLGSVQVVNIPQLRAMNFPIIRFTGEYKHLLGEPSPNFFLLLKSDAGVGKSTFAIKFANYLAKNFANTIYICNEEGIGKTLQLKVNLITDSVSARCFFAEIKEYRTLRQMLQTTFSICRFVFIDSITYSKIDAPEMKTLRNENPDKAFIVIAQKNKKGQSRGSAELEYDTDIILELSRDDQVNNAIARTTKNRFLQTGKEMKIF